MKTLADWQPVGDVVNWNDQYRTLRRLIDAFNGQPELQGRLHATRKLHALTAAELRRIEQFLLVLEPFEGKFPSCSIVGIILNLAPKLLFMNENFKFKWKIIII